jgi:hypothetical protein
MHSVTGRLRDRKVRHENEEGGLSSHHHDGLSAYNFVQNVEMRKPDHVDARHENEEA